MKWHIPFTSVLMPPESGFLLEFTAQKGLPSGYG